MLRQQRNPAHLHSGDTFDAVVLGETLREHGEARLEQGGDGEVLADELAQKGTRFPRHAFVQEKTVLGVKLRIGGGFVEAAELEPLVGKSLDEALAARVGEKTVHLGADDPGASQGTITRFRQ